MYEELQKLETSIKKVENPSVSVQKKAEIKRNMLVGINKLEATKKAGQEISVLSSSTNMLRKAIKKLSNTILLKPASRARIKEHILTSINTKSSKVFIFNTFRVAFQKAFVFIIIAGVVLTSATLYIADIPMIRASRQTYFQEVKGVVEVLRDGEIIEAYEGMMLQQSDVITTGANGMAFIRYIDDSVTRLSPLAELKINKLSQDDEHNLETNIELELLRGRVWSQVINVIDENSSFTLSVNDILVGSDKKTSFDVENDVKNENIKVKVFDNSVGLSFQKDERDEKQFLGEGYEVMIDEKNPAFRKITINKDGRDPESWIRINKAKDEEYKAKIEEEQQQRD